MQGSAELKIFRSTPLMPAHISVNFRLIPETPQKSSVTSRLTEPIPVYNGTIHTPPQDSRLALKQVLSLVG